jgi:hypothetical protein
VIKFLLIFFKYNDFERKPQITFHTRSKYKFITKFLDAESLYSSKVQIRREILRVCVCARNRHREQITCRERTANRRKTRCCACARNSKFEIRYRAGKGNLVNACVRAVLGLQKVIRNITAFE